MRTPLRLSLLCAGAAGAALPAQDPGQFDGQRALVKKEGRARTWLKQYIERLTAMSEEERRSEEGYAKYLRQRFEGLAPKDIHADPEALAEWYAENEEYVYTVDRWKFALDEDLKELGLSNRKPEFLDAMLARLEDDPEDALAHRLVRRYAGEGFADAAAFRRWVEENRDHLFFTDTGGYRWMVDENAKRAAAKGSGG